MAERNLYKEAFINQYNLIALAFSVVLSIVTFSFLPLLAMVGLEIMYLAFLPETEFFKRLTDNKYLEFDEESASRKLQMRLAMLSPSQRVRFETMSTLIGSTRTNLDNQAADLSSIMIDKLARLKERFLWMMETQNNYDRYLVNVDHDALKNSLMDVSAQVSSAKGRVKSSLDERHRILSKRLEKLDTVYENRAVVSTQVKTVEDIMRLIYESSMTMSDPRGISQQIDDLLIDVEATEETVFELDGTGEGDSGYTFDEFDSELEKAIEEADLDLEVEVNH